MLDKLHEQIIHLEGVISGKIIEDDNGQIEEIHIVASKSRNAKNLVRDIETLVQVNLDKEIDHKKISIAQVNIHSEPGGKERVELVAINRLYNQPICEVHIRLGKQDFKERYEGDLLETVPELVARAMIKTLENILPREVRLEVKNIFFSGNNNEIMVIEVFWITLKDGRVVREPLVGTAYIKGEITIASGQALLDAVNRKIQLAMTE